MRTSVPVLVFVIGSLDFRFPSFHASREGLGRKRASKQPREDGTNRDSDYLTGRRRRRRRPAALAPVAKLRGSADPTDRADTSTPILQNEVLPGANGQNSARCTNLGEPSLTAVTTTTTFVYVAEKSEESPRMLRP